MIIQHFPNYYLMWLQNSFVMKRCTVFYHILTLEFKTILIISKDFLSLFFFFNLCVLLVLSALVAVSKLIVSRHYDCIVI